MHRPASRQMSTRRVASLTSLEPQALKNSLPPPKVPVPKVSAGTMKPEAPSLRYSMSVLLHESLRRAHAAAHGGLECRGIFRIHIVPGEQQILARPEIHPVQAGYAGDGRALFGDHARPARVRQSG